MSLAPDDPYRAIVLKLAAVLSFVIMAAMIKGASDEVPPGEAVFFRSLFALPIIVVWLAVHGQLRSGLKAHSPRAHIWRGIMGTSAMAMSFAGLAVLPLSEVMAIQYTMPLFMVILAALLLGETVRKVRLTAVGLGMIGVLIILWPRLSAFSEETVDPRLAVGAMIVLAGTLCAAFAQVSVRRMVATENTSAIVFWFSIMSTCLALFTLPFGWVVPSTTATLLLVGSGLIGGVGQVLVTSAYRYADASVIAPFEYASMLFAVAIGYVFFSEVPTLGMMAGAALVIAAGVLVILRERYLRIQSEKGRSHVTK